MAIQITTSNSRAKRGNFGHVKVAAMYYIHYLITITPANKLQYKQRCISHKDAEDRQGLRKMFMGGVDKKLEQKEGRSADRRLKELDLKEKKDQGKV